MPFIFCLYFLKKGVSKDLKVFFVYSSVLFLSIVVLIMLRYVFKSYTTYLFYNRFYLVAEFALISQFFVYNIAQPKLKKVINFLILPFVVFSIFDYITSQNQPFTYYTLAFECILFPFIILLFFYEKMKYDSKYPIYYAPAFWIAVAFLIFSTGNFFLFLFSKMLLQNKENKILYNDIYGTFTILKNILLCVAVIVAKNSTNNDNPSDINVSLDLDTKILFNNKANI